MSNLHRSRRLALQGLCCLDAQGPSAWGLIEHFIRDSKEQSLVVDSAIKMMRQAFDDRPACDDLLRRHAKRWELNRLALVDRNLLRLAVYELRKSDLAVKIIVNEAIKIAREFSTAESPRFVNGVLDAVATELHGKEVADPDAPPPPTDAP